MELKPKNIHYKERIEGHLTRQNFMHHIEFNLNLIKPGYTEGGVTLKPMHFQQDGFAHGGVIATIADIVAGFAAYTVVRADDHVVTGEIKISFFRKGYGDKLKAIGRVIKPGGKINFCEAEVYSITNNTEILIAKASTSMVTI